MTYLASEETFKLKLEATGKQSPVRLPSDAQPVDCTGPRSDDRGVLAQPCATLGIYDGGLSSCMTDGAENYQGYS